jgi:AraC-like DNA-binding protein
MGEQGDRLRHIAVQAGHTHRIGRAIERLRNEFDQPHRMDDIARELGMSVSSFHHLWGITNSSIYILRGL